MEQVLDLRTQLFQDFLDPFCPDERIVTVHQLYGVAPDQKVGHCLDVSLEFQLLALFVVPELVDQPYLTEEMLSTEVLTVDPIRKVFLILVKLLEFLSAIVEVLCFHLLDLFCNHTVLCSEIAHLCLTDRVKQVAKVV